MHEFPITQKIVKRATEVAKENGAANVESITLVVGDYSGYISDSIDLYFDIIAQGTPCEGAKLNLIRVKPKYRCEKCGVLFERELYSFACPDCDGQGFPTEIGKEFYIKEIIVR